MLIDINNVSIHSLHRVAVFIIHAAMFIIYKKPTTRGDSLEWRKKFGLKELNFTSNGRSFVIVRAKPSNPLWLQ